MPRGTAGRHGGYGSNAWLVLSRGTSLTGESASAILYGRVLPVKKSADEARPGVACRPGVLHGSRADSEGRNRARHAVVAAETGGGARDECAAGVRGAAVAGTGRVDRKPAAGGDAGLLSDSRGDPGALPGSGSAGVAGRALVCGAGDAGGAAGDAEHGGTYGRLVRSAFGRDGEGPRFRVRDPQSPSATAPADRRRGGLRDPAGTDRTESRADFQLAVRSCCEPYAAARAVPPGPDRCIEWREAGNGGSRDAEAHPA